MAGLLIDPLADAVPAEDREEYRVTAVRLYLYQQFSPKPLKEELAGVDFGGMGFDVEFEQQDGGDSTIVETTLLLKPTDGGDWAPREIMPKLSVVFDELRDLSPCVDLLGSKKDS